MRRRSPLAENFSQSFREIMDLPGAPSYADIARHLGLSRVYISQIARGESGGTEMVRRGIARYLGVEYEIMAGIRLPAPFRELPLMKGQVIAPDFPVLYPAKWAELTRDATPAPMLSSSNLDRHRDPAAYMGYLLITGADQGDLIVFQINADYMSPTAEFLEWVVADRGDTEIEDEGLYIGFFEECEVRRAAKSARLTMMVCDNHNEEIPPVELTDPGKVVGRVIGRWHPHERV